MFRKILFICFLLASSALLIYIIIFNTKYINKNKEIDCTIKPQHIYARYTCKTVCTPDCINISNTTRCSDLHNYYKNLKSIKCYNNCPTQEMSVFCSDGPYFCDFNKTLHISDHKCSFVCDYRYSTKHTVEYYLNGEKNTSSIKICPNTNNIDALVQCKNNMINYKCYYDTNLYFVAKDTSKNMLNIILSCVGLSAILILLIITIKRLYNDYVIHKTNNDNNYTLMDNL